MDYFVASFALVLPWLALQKKEARHADHYHAQERDQYAASSETSGQHCKAGQKKQNRHCLSGIRSHQTPPPKFDLSPATRLLAAHRPELLGRACTHRQLIQEQQTPDMKARR
jgi:hypothetical protein